MKDYYNYTKEANSQPNLKAKQEYYNNLANAFEYAINQLTVNNPDFIQAGVNDAKEN